MNLLIRNIKKTNEKDDLMIHNDTINNHNNTINNDESDDAMTHEGGVRQELQLLRGR